MFGSEYDKVLEFIDNNNENYSLISHSYKQETILHAAGTKTQPGKEFDIVNNIVDIEGNLNEWTAEASGTSYRLVRGGFYFSASFEKYYPASEQYSLRPTDASSGNGVRQALYVII